MSLIGIRPDAECSEMGFSVGLFFLRFLIFELMVDFVFYLLLHSELRKRGSAPRPRIIFN